MLTVCKKDKCAGCMACVDICPKNAITIMDTLSEYNAVIDEEKCINCDACRKVCQENNMPELNKPVFWKEGWAEDESVRAGSSSGGAAAEIEKAFVRDGGVVCSCELKNGKFVFSFAEGESEIEKFTGSKYVKSNPSGAYKDIRKILKSGKKVLFLGLPCQAAAVRNFTSDHENLYTADLICHGTPSPNVLESFLADYKTDLNSVQKLTFRTNNKFCLKEKNKTFPVPTVTDTYTRTFLDSVTYTENCYSCKYAVSRRVSDITLGDSWGSELPEDVQNKGVSLVLCQSEKGKKLVESAALKLYDVDLERAIEYNHQLRHPSVKASERDSFFTELKKGKSFKRVIRKTFPVRYLKNIGKTVLYKIHIKR